MNRRLDHVSIRFNGERIHHNVPVPVADFCKLCADTIAKVTGFVGHALHKQNAYNNFNGVLEAKATKGARVGLKRCILTVWA